MIDERQVFERVIAEFVPPDDSLERLVRRRYRKRRFKEVSLSERNRSAPVAFMS